MNSDNENTPTISSNTVSKIAGISIPVIVVLTILLIYLPSYVSSAFFATLMLFTAIFLVTKKRFIFYAMALALIGSVFLTTAVIESYWANTPITDLATLGFRMMMRQISSGFSSVGSGLLTITISMAIFSANKASFKTNRFKYIYIVFFLLTHLTQR